MNRLVTKVINSTWVAPAGVTEISVCGCDSSGVATFGQRVIPVTPNTSYTVTINSSSYAVNNSNTFGGTYTWTGSGYLLISWVE